MAHYWQYGDPFTLITICDRKQAEQLVSFDHHQVIANDCWGILITYPWIPIDTASEPLIATVFLNPAPKHTTSEAQIRTMVRKHPVAPPEIQAIIDQLDFHPPES